MRWLARVMALVFALAVLGLAGIGFLAWQYNAPGPLEAPARFVVEEGAGLNAVAADLQQAGIIDNQYVLRLGARIFGGEGTLRFGEYEIPAAASPAETLALLRSGAVVEYRVTIPEGLTSWEVVRRLENDPNLTGTIDRVPPDGTLLPETYLFQRGTSRQDLLDRMAAAMDEAVAELWAERADDLPFDTPEDAVILASIVEKETGVAGERAEVAGVFVNRLNAGMRLQTDPTVIYALTEGQGPLGRPLTRADLEMDDPYNTYVVAGLPPGPIANPGRAALEAAMNPAETEHFYFVADCTGGHAFARTNAEHNRNVAEYRRLRDAGQCE
jgi:UPF0755 protein